MGTIKDRNGKALTEAEEIKKRWQEHTKELFKKGLNDLYNYACVVTHVALDILECEVKWALGSITTSKASGSNGIPTKLFPKLYPKRGCYQSAALNMPENLENSAVTTGLENVSFHSSSKEGRCQRCSNNHTIALISHATKVILKILQARLQQYVN